MIQRLPFSIVLLASLFLGFSAVAADEDLRTLVRGGCLDEADCCFGKWKVKTAAPIYTTDDAIDKAGAVVAGQEVEGVAGRVHSDPGKLKIVFNHGEWKKGQTIGLYSEPDDNGIARVGTAMNAKDEKLTFIKNGSKCATPTKECWANALSHPKVKWWIKVKLSDDKSGWVDSVNIETDSECKI